MIRLTRSIQVVSFDVEATVAVGRDRPEFLAVARLAADLARPIGAHDILRELLGERPEVLGWRVIERCIDLGLLERTDDRGPAALSEAGRIALDHGEVLVPEEGIWRFYLVDDPLVPAVMIHAERLESESVHDQRKAMKEARARGEERIRPDRPPQLLRQCSGAEPCASLQTGHLLQIVELANKGAAGPAGSLRLTLTMDPAPAVHVTGHLPTDTHGPIDGSVEVPPMLERLSYDVFWKALAAHATRVSVAELDRWHAAAGRLTCPTSFDGLAPEHRKAFERNLDVPNSNWEGLGQFEPTVLERVALVPASEADAQAWLVWLQWEAINDYTVPAQLERVGQQLAAERFPHHRPRPLTSTTLLEKAKHKLTRERDDKAWFILAPADLGLWS